MNNTIRRWLHQRCQDETNRLEEALSESDEAHRFLQTRRALAPEEAVT